MHFALQPLLFYDFHYGGGDECASCSRYPT